ncbi:MAG: hypothetical protein ACR2G5_05060 [Pyrinomonadaceae bacterium]
MKYSQQSFGGEWTSEKLKRVRKYLVAYATIMNKQKFRYAYIDAFAGTGYRTLKHDEKPLSRISLKCSSRIPKSFLMARPELPFKLNPTSPMFAGVAENPLPLFNSRNVPLYLLCFASGNSRGAKAAIKIAQDILRPYHHGN